MLRAPHILAAVFCCISVLSELVPAEPGRCPKLSNKTVDWVSMANRANITNDDFYLHASIHLGRNINPNPNGPEESVYCEDLEVPPKPSSRNDVEGVVDTDNNEFVVYMKCKEHSKGHTKDLITYTVKNINDENLNEHEQLINKLKAAHIANGFRLENFKICNVPECEIVNK